ncbi:MAG TPA: IS607 family element RNA-guided endonuclease TnpB [Candidatus Dormibacteraeota bacterium]|nr:IS607 family element RNA-guided endonuclease TnpB [Candidatus Dormibacteraeota bacterium]
MAKVQQALRFALDPNAGQRRELARHAGTARYAYNWGLRRVMDGLAARRAGDTTVSVPSAMTLHREWNAWKQSPEGIPWWTEVSKCAPQEAFRNLEWGLRAYWAGRDGKRPGPQVRFPGFKKKSRSRDSFRLTGALHLHAGAATLPRIGAVRLCEDATRWASLVTVGSVRITSATVSREADRWFVALAVEAERAIPSGNGHTDTMGVDLGVVALATLSNGTVIPGPKALRRGLRKLRQLSRAHSRKRRGSRNRAKAARRLTRHHAKVGSLRRDHLHKLTTTLAKNHGRIVVEDLNVQGMLRNRKLARSLADAGFGEFRRQLAYKCRWYGSELVVADRWFASSKTCSRCGTVKPELLLRERTFRCESCGLAIDRDLNAAINLAGSVHPAVTASAVETRTACGADQKSRPRLAGGKEAGTGIAPEPTDSIGGPTPRPRDPVSLLSVG